MTTLRMELGSRSYDIHIGGGLIAKADKYLDLDRKVFILTDDGVPAQYAQTVAALAEDAFVLTIPQGEESKSLETYDRVCKAMLDFGMSRGDCAVAVGGGVIGDLCGFAASTYMRGVDFYNIPTTVLSQVDSSIGGKCAIDFHGVKNIIGSFYQPKCVIVDIELLSTLDSRQVSNGLAEAVKMALTSDRDLFEFFEKCEDISAHLEEIVVGALKIKKSVVEADEKEGSLRKILNFGHTLGHGIESLGGRYHGECVALGMLPMCSGKVRARLVEVLKKLSLPHAFTDDIDVEKALAFAAHDKKADSSSVSAVFVDTVGKFRLERIALTGFYTHIRETIDDCKE